MKTRVARLILREITEKMYFFEVPWHVSHDDVRTYVCEQEFLQDTPPYKSNVIHQEERDEMQVTFIGGPTEHERVIALDPDYTGWPETEQQAINRCAEERIWEHYQSVKGKVVYAEDLQAFSGDDRDHYTFNPPIPVKIIETQRNDMMRYHDEWIDSEYDVEPIFPDPRLAELRTFTVNGLSVRVLSREGDPPVGQASLDNTFIDVDQMHVERQ